jgi:hypothetical protein
VLTKQEKSLLDHVSRSMVALVPSKKKPGKPSAKGKLTGYLPTFIEPDKIEKVQARADQYTEGNRSNYVRRLIDNDLNGLPSPSSYDPQILCTLAKVYAGYFAPQLTAELERHGVNQPKLLHDLLAAFCEGLACGYKPAELTVAPKICTTWAPVGDHMREPAVAEQQAPYQIASDAKRAMQIITAEAAAAHQRESSSREAGTTLPAPEKSEPGQ